MFKFYELLTKITSIIKPTTKSSRGFNIAYQDPEDNKGFLLHFARKRLNK